jgi:glycosyltransferase involved in cell wall biosynthesis
MVGPWPPTRGGVTTFMCNVVGSSLKEKYDFIAFTTSRPAKRNLKGDNYGYAAVFRGGFKRVVQGIVVTLWHLAVYPWVVLLRRPALIQVQASDFQAFWEASLYVLLGNIFRFPVVLRIGGSFNRFWDSSGKRARAAIQWALRQPSMLVVQSEYWKAYVAGAGRGGPTLTLNNFVPDALVEKRIVRARPAPRFLLYCSDMPKIKGAYVLLDAVAELVSRGVRVDVTLMAVTASLRDEVTRSGLDRHVRMLDPLSHGEALAVLRRTDVFLQISSSEGFPNMLLEAMALGCAAIVTPVGAVPEIVGADGQCAFVIPVGDCRALADRMAQFATDGGVLAPMAAAAQARIAEQFTESTALQVLDRAYQSVIRRRG